MSSQPEKMTPGKGVEDADNDSTEGHLARVKMDQAGDDDTTEGHPVKRGIEPAGTDDDTEGHPLRK
jgi:hypothetical protein